jgi:hypothetical protein
VSFFSRVYGLSLSANFPIPGLAPSPPREHRIDIVLGELPLDGSWSLGSSELIYEGNFLTVRRFRVDSFLFQYDNGTKFVVESGGGRIWAEWPDPLTLEDAATYLLGPVLGFVLRLRGMVCLHASAIRVQDCAVAFVGDSGAGKSTLAAKFVERGHRVLSDDVLPLHRQDGRFFAQPGYPRLRLWPDTAEGLYSELPALTPNWDKRYLDLGDRFQDEMLPLAAIYVLGDRSANADRPRFEDISPTEAYWALISNTYSNYLLNQSLRAQEFDTLAAVLETTPVRIVIPSSEPGSVDSLCSFLMDNLSQILVP